MPESLVTVVRCRRCTRTGDLSLRGERFWCAWCQDWAAVDAENVENAIIDRTDTGARLAPRPPAWHPLQPLRVPAGWTVTYNTGLYEVEPLDPSIPEDERRGLFKEDMLTLRHDRANRLLDVGWYPDADVEAGEYGLLVYAGDFRGQLLHEYHGRDRTALVAEIERLLALIADGGM